MDIAHDQAGAADCRIGILVLDCGQGKADGAGTARACRALEEELCARYSGLSRGELKSLHPMDAYIAYYKRFGYSYHVLGQLESVAKGKALADGLPLVQAMFMAELRNMLLTAGHDLDLVRLPLRFAAATGEERYLALSGKETQTVPGDMMITDRDAVISSILRGPDARTAITEHTRRVLYTVYAPAGVAAELVEAHLADIEAYVRLSCADAKVERRQMLAPGTFL